MADDEAATLRSLNDARDIFRKRIQAHGGRLIDTAGDSILAEFPSAVEAVDCSEEIQHELAKRNHQAAEHRRMQFRIGINLGDVIVQEDGTIYGDGVNVAARLQSLAEPGGICISSTAFDQVEGKLALDFNFAGQQQVKNIAKPVRVYQQGERGRLGKVPSRSGKTRRLALTAGMLLVSVLVGIQVWHKARTSTASVAEQPTVAETSDSVLAMPTGPRLAVLPFANLSGDPKEDYFAEGLTEDIITELARFREIYVLARNTTYQYKGQAVDVPAVGRKLGVQYLLEGSVRKSGSQVRITGQLIDVQTGAHIWAERYDRNLRDIFLVQDEIARKIAGSIAGGPGGTLQAVARRTVERKSEEELKAYDYVLRATLQLQWSNPEGYPKAKAALQKAMLLDPNYARARQTYAWVTFIGWLFRYEKTAAPPREVKENAIRSVELDPTNPQAHQAAAFGYYFDKQFESFEREASIAMELAPNNPEILSPLAFLIAIHGQWERGVKLANKAYSLNAVSADGWYTSALFYDFHRRGMYREAVEVLKFHSNPGIVENLQKYTAAYAELGDLQRAREYWAKCKAIDGEWSADKLNGLGDLWSFERGFWTRYMQSIAKAGYPVTK
jgi:adenylate cyclase